MTQRLRLTTKWLLCAAAALMVLTCTSSAQAATVRITVDNIGPATGGTYVTSIFAGFHDGSFSLGSVGSVASAELQTLAELGQTAPLQGVVTGAGFEAGQVGAPGPSPLAPNTSRSEDFVIDLTTNNQLTLASMILPSSDFFLANLSGPLDLSTLTAAGDTVNVTLSTLYDAGTELNDLATSPGNPLVGLTPGVATNNVADTNNLIRAVTPATAFDDFLNNPTNFSPTISSLNVTVELIAVPEPSTGFAICAVLGGLTIRRRRRAK